VIAITVALIAAASSIIVAIMTAKQNGKINETHKQVTVNSHSSANPTVLDLISDVKEEQVRVRVELSDHKQAVSEAIERHLEWHLGEKK
jgi:flagellar basal body-associated protein FliL